MLRSLPLVCLLILLVGCAASAAGPTQHAENLRWGIALPDVPTLDPALASDPVSLNIASLVYGGLVRFNAQLRVVPDGAARWTISPNGRVYTFTLRRGLRYANDRPVHAADVVAALQRALGPEGSAGTAPLYLSLIAPHGITAPDPHTVRITLSYPAAHFLTELAFPASFVPEPEVLNRYGATWTNHAAGFGPYYVQSWQHGQTLVLARNPHYFGGRPSVRRIVLHFYQGVSEALRAYQHGQLDIVSGLPAGQPAPHGVAGARAVPALALDYLAFNTRHVPFSRLSARRAFVSTIENPASAMGGAAFHSTGLLPASLGITIPAWHPLRTPAQYLARADYPSGRGFPLVSLVLPRDPHLLAVAHALQARWQHTLGVQISVHPLNPTNYGTVLNSHAFDLAIVRWGGDYPDPQDFLATQLGLNPNNVTGWSSAQVRALLRRADLEAPSAPQRSALFRKAAVLAERHAPLYPLDQPAVTAVLRPGLEGISLTALGTIEGDWHHVRFRP